jgi:hypothetical protein
LGARGARLVNHVTSALGVFFVVGLMYGIPQKLPLGGAWLLGIVAVTAGALLAAQRGNQRRRERA